MVLFLTAIDRQGQNRDISCQLEELEVIFELLSHIVAKGDILLNAYIQDDNQLTSLPLEAFDGSPFLMPLRELQQEWQSVLNRLSDPTPVSEAHAALIRQYENRIRSIERMVNGLYDLQQRAQACMSSAGSPSGVSTHFALLRAKYERQLGQTQLSYQRALDRLTRLTT